MSSSSLFKKIFESYLKVAVPYNFFLVFALGDFNAKLMNWDVNDKISLFFFVDHKLIH